MALRPHPRDSLEAASRELAAWRRQRLLAAGFDEALATRLAGGCAIDLHALLALVDRGCPPELATRILAPLEEEGARGEHRPGSA